MSVTYEYMDEINIDDELKFTICTQPFQKPVSLSCQHTFCRECIEFWLNEHHSCPTCRRSLLINQDEKFSPINTYIIRPIIDRLRNQLDTSLKIQNELYEKFEHQSDHINFLLAFINQGNTMNKEYLKLYSRCQYSKRNQTKSTIIFHCTLCDNIIKRRHVSLHACSLNDHIHCICQTCYEKQYPIPEDKDDDKDDE